MKRKLRDEDESVGGILCRTADVDWNEQDRQPDWQDAVAVHGKGNDGEEEEDDGDVFILESRRRQQRLMTPEQTDGDDQEPPGAPKKKKRRILPWTREGQLLLAQKVETTAESEGSDDDVVLVKDSQVEESEDSETEESEAGTVVSVEDSEDSEDDCSSFVVDDDSESVTAEEDASEKSLGGEALREVRAEVVRRILRLQRQLKSVDKELDALTSEESDVEQDRLRLAAFRERTSRTRGSKCVS